jgi:hypothetical protein
MNCQAGTLQIDPNTQHKGAPVGAGSKWILNFFYSQLHIQKPHKSMPFDFKPEIPADLQYFQLKEERGEL